MNTLMGSQVDSVHSESGGLYRGGFDALRVSDVGDHGSMMFAIRAPIEYLEALPLNDLDELPNPPEISPFTEIGHCF